MFNVTIFSSSLEFIKIINKFFYIQAIYTDKPINYRVKNWTSKKKIKIIFTKNKKEFKKKNKIKIISDLGLSFGFSIIFRDYQIKKFKYGIWNFHTGDLPKYQGRHPITYAFLNNEKKIALTIHKIDKNIDQGKLLYKKFVIRRNRDTEKEIINKIIKIMPNGIKNSIFNYKNRKLKNIKKGKILSSSI